MLEDDSKRPLSFLTSPPLKFGPLFLDKAVKALPVMRITMLSIAHSEYRASGFLADGVTGRLRCMRLKATCHSCGRWRIALARLNLIAHPAGSPEGQRRCCRFWAVPESPLTQTPPAVTLRELSIDPDGLRSRAKDRNTRPTLFQRNVRLAGLIILQSAWARTSGPASIVRRRATREIAGNAQQPKPKTPSQPPD